MTYILVNLPGVYFFAQFDVTKKLLNCLKNTWVPMIVQVGANILHVAWCEILVIRFDLGMQGLGLASAITFLTLWVSTTVYAS